ncbi:MAG: heparin lyase I family protein [Rhodospirillales bacterium]|nr:heparin lyase I family protein [Rhodospirillales bacterium]MCB9980227.1 heparin lyase I family protein [Rhodospirillales bacterium]
MSFIHYSHLIAFTGITAVSISLLTLAEASEQSKIADILGLKSAKIQIECPQKTYEITPDHTLKFCLDRDHHEKRCEIAVYTLEPAPAVNKIGFSVRLSEDIQSWKNFYAIMQIHGLPDKGEAWRCPPLSMDIRNGYLSLYNRWDDTAHSFTTGTHCLEPGSTLQGRTLIDEEKIRAHQWYDFDMTAVLSSKSDGRMTYQLDKIPPQTVTGGNIYNDKKMPYLKLGVYKPTDWSPQQHRICAEYKNIDLSVQK